MNCTGKVCGGAFLKFICLLYRYAKGLGSLAHELGALTLGNTFLADAGSMPGFVRQTLQGASGRIRGGFTIALAEASQYLASFVV